jgi:branched-chain amino acid aminotransferase
VINVNGELLDPTQVQFSTSNRAFRYGDGVFETLKYARGAIHFFEDHYFRLMSTMRILRMEIPMHFDPEYLQKQINETIEANHTENQANRIRVTVFRKGAGFYAPETNEVAFTIETEALPDADYELNAKGLQVDLFKDFYVHKSMLSNLKTANAQLYVLAGIFKTENNLDECLLINDEKHVVEAISSNLFMVKDGIVHTPELATGCLKGVMRKNMIQLLKNLKIEVVEDAFSPFALQRADELWLTNAIQGVQWVERYRKKTYGNKLAKTVSESLNRYARLK